ncbi:MAG: hypothetical protein ACXIT4_05955 [Erythrobacter sp.]
MTTLFHPELARVRHPAARDFRAAVRREPRRLMLGCCWRKADDGSGLLAGWEEIAPPKSAARIDGGFWHGGFRPHRFIRFRLAQTSARSAILGASRLHYCAPEGGG